MHCLAGLDDATGGAVFIGDVDITTLGRQAADPAAPRRGRLHLPGVQPAPDAQRHREHHAADGHRRSQAGPGVAGHRRSTRIGLRDRLTHRPDRAVRRAAAARRRAPAHWPAARRSSSPTSRPATSTAPAAPRCSAFLRRSATDMGQTIVMVTHDPGAASYADRVLFLADGRIVDEMAGADRRGRPRPDEEVREVVHVAVDAPMIRATFKSLAARKLRLLLSSLSIVLGVSFVAGAFVLTDSLGKVFDDLFSDRQPNVAVDVRGDKVTSGDQGGDVRTLLPAGPRRRPSERRRRPGGAGPGPGPAPSWSARTARSSAPAVRPRSASTGTTPTCCRAGQIVKGRAPTGPDEIAINRRPAGPLPTTRSVTRHPSSPTSR